MIGRFSRFRDPPRLTDDASLSGDGLGALIEQVRQDAPDHKTANALFTRIEPRLTQGAAPAQTTASALVKTGSIVSKTVVALGVAGAVAASALWFSARTADVQEAAPPPVTRTPAPRGLPAPPAVEDVPPPVPAAKTEAATGRAGSRQPPARSDVGTRARAESVKSQPAPPVASEAELLRDALDALMTDPSRALTIADEHARRYPEGALTQEREVIVIESLVKLGRTESARLRARKLLTAHPSTAHNARIKALLDGDRSKTD